MKFRLAKKIFDHPNAHMIWSAGQRTQAMRRYLHWWRRGHDVNVTGMLVNLNLRPHKRSILRLDCKRSELATKKDLR